MRVYGARIRFRIKFLVLRLHILPNFFGRKYISKKIVVRPDLIPSPCIHTHVYFVHIYECKSFRDLINLNSSGPPSISSLPLGSHRAPRVCSACACARIHRHTHTYTPTRVKNSKDTRQHFHRSFS